MSALPLAPPLSMRDAQLCGTRETVKVNKDTLQGSAKDVGGKLKETAGNVTGDQKLRTEGVLDQIKGKLQNAVGNLRDLFKGR